MNDTALSVAVLALAVAVSGCNKDEPAASGGAATSSPGKGPAFDLDKRLPTNCKANVELLVACAGRNKEPAQSELIAAAKTMQSAYLEEVTKSGAAAADTRCKQLESIVKMNARCK